MGGAAQPRGQQELLLYSVLGVPQAATPAQIQRAYKLRARQVHPDKNPEDEGAKAAFQQLRSAYETLSDPERRRCYDEFGDDGLGSNDGSLAEAARELVRARFRPVTLDEIAEFERSYRGSAEERADISQFAAARKGDISNLFEYIVCSEPEDIERLVSIIEDLMRTEGIKKKLHCAVARSIPKLRRKAAALAKRNAKEGRQLEKSKLAVSSVSGSLADLALAIQGRQAERAQALEQRLDSVAITVAPTLAARKRPAGREGVVTGAKKAKAAVGGV